MLPILARGAFGAAALFAVTASSLAQAPSAPKELTPAPHPDTQHTPAEPVYRVGALVVAAPWARATPAAAKVAGGYMRITNTGSAPDRLVDGSSTASGRFEVHQMSVADGVMRMRPLEHGLEIKPGETVELKPGGYHAMLFDLKRPLKEGETLSGTLQFEKAGTLTVDYAVRSIGAQATGDGQQHH